LIETFRIHAVDRPHTLLIVTKGGARECRVFFEHQPCRNVVISFSVNCPEAAAKYELGAASVSDRMETAGN